MANLRSSHIKQFLKKLFYMVYYKEKFGAVKGWERILQFFNLHSIMRLRGLPVEKNGIM